VIFDGLVLKRVVNGLQNIVGQQLRQVYQKGKSEFFFKFSRSGLNVSLDPSTPYISFGEKDESSSLETPFSIYLRRHLNGLFLESITQEKTDRIVRLILEGGNAFGMREIYQLVIELMGPGSNMIVLDGKGTVTHAFREMITEKRTLARGVRYVPPEPRGKDLSSLSDGEIRSSMLVSGEKLPKAIWSTFSGISKRTSHNITGYLGLEEVAPDELEDEKLDELCTFLGKIASDFNSSILYTCLNEGEMEISPIPLDFKGDCKAMQASMVINEALVHFGVDKEIDRRRRSIVGKLLKAIARQEKLIEKLERELQEVNDYDRYRYYGELLVANLYRLKDRTPSIELEDWESGERIRIDLDDRLTPSENAQLFFKYYDKSRRKEIQVTRRLKELNSEREYLEQLEEMVSLSENLVELDSFKDELRQAGIIRAESVEKKRKRTPPSGPRIFERHEFKYLVGKNNTQNDEITKAASKEDFWFHARGIPGAHVILKKAGKDVPEKAIRFGAALAGRYSKGRFSGKVEVVYTTAGNIIKPKGAKPGMVVYRKAKTILVDLSTELEEGL
jgi:predicted ribosome quality control (RQC) complex YloA/Tae2 family protein